MKVSKETKFLVVNIGEEINGSKMNIVNYIRFGQDPRNGGQQQLHSPKDEFSPEESEDASFELAGASLDVKPIPVPEYTTREWLQRFSKLQD